LIFIDHNFSNELFSSSSIRNEESIEMLRRFQSEPVLPNPHLESNNFKIKSDLRQSILHRHRHVTPMSDNKRHPMRSATLAQKQQQQQQQQQPPLPPHTSIFFCFYEYMRTGKIARFIFLKDFQLNREQ